MRRVGTRGDELYRFSTVRNAADQPGRAPAEASSSQAHWTVVPPAQRGTNRLWPGKGKLRVEAVIGTAQVPVPPS